RIADELVRQKAALRVRPQQLVEPAGVGAGRRPDQHVPAEIDGFLREPACEREPRIRSGRVEDVEVDLGHPGPAFSRKSTSSGTGRPVAPLFPSARHATPAMSRCAHGMPSTNFARKLAATLAPPSRVPEFAKSAKLLFSDSA